MVPRLDEQLQKKSPSYGFVFKLLDDDVVYTETHELTMTSVGNIVTLQWYIPLCALEATDASSFVVEWPDAAQMSLQPNLPESLRKLQIHPQIGKWVSRHGEERIIGLYWDPVECRFEVCDVLEPLEGKFDTGGQWCLMPTLVSWVKK